jgi:hypothetical protein
VLFEAPSVGFESATGGLSASTLCSRIGRLLVGYATFMQTIDTYSHVMLGMGNVAATALEEALD